MTPFYADDYVTLFHAKAEDVLSTLDRVDHVITDPPYSEHVHSKSRRGQSLPDAWQFPACISRARELGFDSMTPETMLFCAGEFARLARRWVLVFSDVELTGDWHQTLESMGLDYVRTGAWIKLNATPQFTGDRPASGFEAITIAHPKGRKRWNGGGTHAVWSEAIVLNRGGKEPRLHTTQKPLALMRRLVSLFTDEGETILDCFAGSGTTGIAAALLGRKAILIEQDEKYCDVAAKRLEKVQMQGVMNFEVSV